MDKLKGKNILIVEDNMGLQKILGDKFEELGISVTHVETAQKAMQSAKESSYNLIILDIMLPGGMNGFDFLEQLKKNETLKNIPVVVLTNLDTERETALQIGAVDYIVKGSIAIDEVISKIEKYMA